GGGSGKDDERVAPDASQPAGPPARSGGRSRVVGVRRDLYSVDSTACAPERVAGGRRGGPGPGGLRSGGAAGRSLWSRPVEGVVSGLAVTDRPELDPRLAGRAAAPSSRGRGYECAPAAGCPAGAVTGGYRLV